MFKNPIKANGDIRYFELSKIMVLFSFLIALLTKNTSSFISPVNTSVFASVLLNLIVIIHVSTLMIAQFLDVLVMIKSFIQEWMYSKRVFITLVVQEITAFVRKSFNTVKTYLLYNVIRC